MVIEPDTCPILYEARDSKEPDSSPDSEPSTPLPIESDWAPIMEFTAADIFQHSPFGDILKSLKYLSLKLKGPARHWLNSLPENFIGSWENLEDAFLDDFQGTYVRPSDADDLSHITQQPRESARKFWTRFLTKKTKLLIVRMSMP